MGTKNHNKKRNVGIIFEQLLVHVSKALVEGNNAKADTCLKVIKNHFKPGTELYREFRLFNALVKTTVSNPSVATQILVEASNAANDIDRQVLRHQKAMLIKEINHTLNESDFYSKRVKNYRHYATIQTLLDDWRRGPRADITRLAEYTDKVHKWLLIEKIEPEIEKERSANVNRLTVRIMREKFNKKYGRYLNSEQATLIKEMTFQSSADSIANDTIRELLIKIKKNAINALEEFKKKNENNILKQKVPVVNQLIESSSITEVSDENISKFLLISKLKDELMEGSNEKVNN